MLAKVGSLAQALAYANTNTIGSHLLLVSTSSEVLYGKRYEKTFCECLEVSKVFPFAALVQLWLQTRHDVASIPFSEVSRESCSV